MTGQRLTEEVDQPECIRDSCDHGGQWPTHHLVNGVDHLMSVGTIITTDGTDIFYKDWGTGQPIVFSHGWPLSADDWDTQMLFFLQHGYRVIAHDRRGHGRSSQTGDGHDMDHYADDLATLIEHLNLRDAIHVGHSTGGGEVVRYLARHGESRSSKAVLISSVPPLMVQTETNPGGLPKDVFDGFQAQLAANRSEFYRWMAEGPFYNFNRPGVEPSEAIIDNWWRQGMMGGAKAHYDGIVAFSHPAIPVAPIWSAGTASPPAMTSATPNWASGTRWRSGRSPSSPRASCSARNRIHATAPRPAFPSSRP